MKNCCTSILTFVARTSDLYMHPRYAAFRRLMTKLRDSSQNTLPCFSAPILVQMDYNGSQERIALPSLVTPASKFEKQEWSG